LRGHHRGRPGGGEPRRGDLGLPGLPRDRHPPIAHELCGLGVPIPPRLLAEVAHTRTGIDIHPDTTGLVLHRPRDRNRDRRDRRDRQRPSSSTRASRSARPPVRGRRVPRMKRHPTSRIAWCSTRTRRSSAATTVVGHDSVVGGNVFLTARCRPISASTRPARSASAASATGSRNSRFRHLKEHVHWKADTILATIGETRLSGINRLFDHRVEVWAKARARQPGREHQRTVSRSRLIEDARGAGDPRPGFPWWSSPRRATPGSGWPWSARSRAYRSSCACRSRSRSSGESS